MQRTTVPGFSVEVLTKKQLNRGRSIMIATTLLVDADASLTCCGRVPASSYFAELSNGAREPHASELLLYKRITVVSEV